jgi:hypothetical protein
LLVQTYRRKRSASLRHAHLTHQSLHWRRSAKRSIQAGLQFDFETPYKGFLNVAAYAYKEWQHDGFASTFPFQPIPNPSGNVNFDTTWAVEINYSHCRPGFR